VEPEELISRAEVEAMLFTFSDISVNVAQILDLLEENYGGEEEEGSDPDT
jgi:hypothetical protein